MSARTDAGKRRIVIVGGGLAGLAAGCYALRSGYSVTIVEHNLALGGVCTAWQRGPYTIDGCIHWLTGGPFDKVYRELEVLPALPLRVLDVWTTYRNVADGVEVTITRDLDALVEALVGLAPEDADELGRLRDASRELMAVEPPLDAPELTSVRDSLRSLWEMRGAVRQIAHYRKSVRHWAEERLRSPALRRLFTTLVPETAPALFLLMVLGYLERGFLSRPVGGTAPFRDALERSYRDRGGQALLHSTVDEILAPHFPELSSKLQMTDLATPLTYWSTARSWRGAYEGWMPGEGAFFSHVEKTLSGLDGLDMAGQWVEPGGGVPMAVTSGRHVAQLICARDERPFVA